MGFGRGALPASLLRPEAASCEARARAACKAAWMCANCVSSEVACCWSSCSWPIAPGAVASCSSVATCSYADTRRSRRSEADDIGNVEGKSGEGGDTMGEAVGDVTAATAASRVLPLLLLACCGTGGAGEEATATVVNGSEALTGACAAACADTRSASGAWPVLILEPRFASRENEETCFIKGGELAAGEDALETAEAIEEVRARCAYGMVDGREGAAADDVQLGERPPQIAATAASSILWVPALRWRFGADPGSTGLRPAFSIS